MGPGNLSATCAAQGRPGLYTHQPPHMSTLGHTNVLRKETLAALNWQWHGL